MSEDDLKLNRRLFLQHSATASAATAWYSIALKTDAMTQEAAKAVGADKGDGLMPYAYFEGEL